MSEWRRLGVLLSKEGNPNFDISVLQGMVVSAGKNRDGTPYLSWCTPAEYSLMRIRSEAKDEKRINPWRKVPRIRMDVIRVEVQGDTRMIENLGRAEIRIPRQPLVLPDDWRDYYELSGRVVELSQMSTARKHLHTRDGHGGGTNDEFHGYSWAQYLSWRSRTLHKKGHLKRDRWLLSPKGREAHKRRKEDIGKRNRAKMHPPRGWGSMRRDAERHCRCSWLTRQPHSTVFWCPVHSIPTESTSREGVVWLRFHTDCLWEPTTQTLVRASDFADEGWSMARAYFDHFGRIKVYLESEDYIVCVALENLDKVPPGKSCHERYVPSGYNRAEWQLVVGDIGEEPEEILESHEVELRLREENECTDNRWFSDRLILGDSLAKSQIRIHRSTVLRIYEERIAEDGTDLIWEHTHSESVWEHRRIPTTQVWWVPLKPEFTSYTTSRDIPRAERTFAGKPTNDPDITQYAGIVVGEGFDEQTQQWFRDREQRDHSYGFHNRTHGYRAPRFFEELPEWLRDAHVSKQYPVCSCGKQRYNALAHDRCSLCRHYRHCLRCGELRYFGEEKLRTGVELYCWRGGCEGWFKDVRHVSETVTRADVHKLVTEARELLAADRILSGERREMRKQILQHFPEEKRSWQWWRIGDDTRYIYVVGNTAYKSALSPEYLNLLAPLDPESVEISSEEFVQLLGIISSPTYYGPKVLKNGYTGAPDLHHEEKDNWGKSRGTKLELFIDKVCKGKALANYLCDWKKFVS